MKQVRKPFQPSACLVAHFVGRGKPIQVRPEEQNVATRKGRARGGKLSIFPHLTLIIAAESKNQNRSKSMQVIHERCAALDVHKKTVVTTIMKTQADGSVQEWTRFF